jgi:hypothetical protein
VACRCSSGIANGQHLTSLALSVELDLSRFMHLSVPEADASRIQPRRLGPTSARLHPRERAYVVG